MPASDEADQVDDRVSLSGVKHWLARRTISVNALDYRNGARDILGVPNGLIRKGG